MTLLAKQKNIIICYILCINAVLSILVSIYYEYWYIFISILALSSSVNSINVLLIITNQLRKISKNVCKNICKNIFSNLSGLSERVEGVERVEREKRKLLYVLPCYNENETELRKTIDSIASQKDCNIYKFLIIICDGKIKGSGNTLTTDCILVDNIFKDYIIYNTVFDDAYKNWFNNWENLEVHRGFYNEIPFLIIVKNKNMGKRDSLTLIRRLTYYYNITKIDEEHGEEHREEHGKENNSLGVLDGIDAIDGVENQGKNYQFIEFYNHFCPEFLNYIEAFFTTKIDSNREINTDTLEANIIYNTNPIEFIIGTDADTILSNQCSYELLKTFDGFRLDGNCNGNGNGNGNLVGVVGMVDVVKNWYNPLVMYQYCEYLYAQCLKRKMQSEITNKVNCLSGCVQLIKVCRETCGNEILDLFNRLPSQNENIFNHIQSYASEDRNHICLMFGLYPYVKTIQSPNAIVYTTVPDNLKALLRQRKRWSVGSIVNDLLIIVNSRHNLWERANAFVNVVIFNVNIFVFVTTVEFIIAIVNSRDMLMLYLATIMLLPLSYSILTPLLIYNDGLTKVDKLKNIVYYYLGLINYYSTGFILNLMIYFYTFYYLDDLNWNAKRINTREHTEFKGEWKEVCDMEVEESTEEIGEELNDELPEELNEELHEELNEESIDENKIENSIFKEILSYIEKEKEKKKDIEVDNNSIENKIINKPAMETLGTSIMHNLNKLITNTVGMFSYFRNKSDNNLDEYIEDTYITDKYITTIESGYTLENNMTNKISNINNSISNTLDNPIDDILNNSNSNCNNNDIDNEFWSFDAI